MTNVNKDENLDSQIEELDVVDDNDDIDALKEKYQKATDKYKEVSDSNRQLFARAKKAEGFELKDGKWIKPEKGANPNPEPKPKADSLPKKSDEFDEGQLAYLVAKGIDSDEDIDFTQAELKKHGGTLRELLGNKYFQGEMKDRKDARIALEATPTNSKRIGSRAGDVVEVEYAKYLKTGKLPADREMRTKLVNMRLKKETADNQFTDQSVIGG